MTERRPLPRMMAPLGVFVQSPEELLVQATAEYFDAQCYHLMREDEMNNIQALMNAIGDNARVVRADYHVTLEQLIEKLSSLPADRVVVTSEGLNPGKATSYRGYYADLAFEPTADFVTCADLLSEAKEALHSTFEGYKGGDFQMDERTPLWIASYGNTGDAIIDIQDDGKVIKLITKRIPD